MAQGQFLKQSTADLSSEFSFSKIGRRTKSNETSLEEIDVFLLFLA